MHTSLSSIGPAGLTRSPDSPTPLIWQQLLTTAAVAAEAKVLWTSARAARGSASDTTIRFRNKVTLSSDGRVEQETGGQAEQTKAAQTFEYKETGLTTLETNRREPLVDVGCICGRGRVGADASLENWRRGRADDGSARRRGTGIRGTRDGEGEGRGQETGPRRNIASSGQSERLVKAKPRPRLSDVF